MYKTKNNIFNVSGSNIMKPNKIPNNYYDNKNLNLQDENKKLKQELKLKNKLLDEYKKKITQLEKTIQTLRNKTNYNNNNNQNNMRNISQGRPIFEHNFQNIFQPFRDLANFGFENDFNDFTDNFFSNPNDFYSNKNLRSGRSRSNYNHINNNNNNNRKRIGFDARDYEDYYENNNFINDNDDFERDIIDQLYPNPDRMTYEQLLELEDKVGNVSKGLSKAQIKKIPNVYYSKKHFKNQEKCAICQYEYKETEKVSKLPCLHIFHNDCIKGWLEKNKVCPICKKEIQIR
jgi:hypothetical protein